MTRPRLGKDSLPCQFVNFGKNFSFNGYRYFAAAYNHQVMTPLPNPGRPAQSRSAPRPRSPGHLRQREQR